MELSAPHRNPQADEMDRRVLVARRAVRSQPSRIRHPMLGLTLLVIIDASCVGLIHHFFY